MRKITYFENMRGNLNNVGSANLLCFKSYELARKCDIDYPIITEMYGDNIINCAKIFTQSRIGKFYYSYSSTSANDDIAKLFMMGYGVIDVVPVNILLGENSYHTCCKFALLIGRRR